MNIEAIDFLNQLNEYGQIDYDHYSYLYDLLTSEEPEWEYGVRNTSSGKTGWPWTRDEALKQAGISPMFEAVQRIRTDWEPVEN